LIGCILLTKSLSCNVVVFIEMSYIPESSKYLEFISLRWEEPYYDKFQCHKLQEGFFNVQGRFCVNSNSEKSDPLFSSRSPSTASGRSLVSNIRPDAHQCPEVSNSSRLHPSGHLSNSSGCSSVFDKKSNFFLRQKYGKTAASVRTTGQHLPDAILDKARCGKELQPSGRQGNTVWTPVLIMKIMCSRSAIVRKLGQHHPGATLIWYYVKRVMESRLHSCLCGRPQLTSGRRIEKSKADSI
jgi:hypothetical protein